MTPFKEITLKLQAIKYFIINAKLFWKDPLGFLLYCLTKPETEGVIDEFIKEYVEDTMLGEKQLIKF
jgi:hypothetical protein